MPSKWRLNYSIRLNSAKENVHKELDIISTADTPYSFSIYR
mgnify:CR=1 FL=1